MKIKEVEERVGLTRSNIRFYEREGLLLVDRDQENNYRDYTEADVEKIAEFPNMQEFLLPVDYKNIDNYIVTQVNIYESSKTIAVIVL